MIRFHCDMPCIACRSERLLMSVCVHVHVCMCVCLYWKVPAILALSIHTLSQRNLYVAVTHHHDTLILPTAARKLQCIPALPVRQVSAVQQ